MSKKKFKRKEAAFTQIYPQFADTVPGDDNHRTITKSKLIRVKKKSLILVDAGGSAIGHLALQENGNYQFTPSGAVAIELQERKAREVPHRRTDNSTRQPRKPRSFSTDRQQKKEGEGSSSFTTSSTSPEPNQQVS